VVTQRRAILPFLVLSAIAAAFGLVLPAVHRTPFGGPTGRVYANSLGMEFIELSRGRYRTGSDRHCTTGDALWRIASGLGWSLGRPAAHAPESCECPREWVEVPGSFWLARKEVHLSTYRRFDSGFERKRPDCICVMCSYGEWDIPAVRVSHRRAVDFCRWLSEREPGTYRLPTEAEWEYACRAGRMSDRPIDAEPTTFAACIDNRPYFSGTGPNPWGFDAIEGGAGEWCSDCLPRRALLHDVERVEGWSGRVCYGPKRPRTTGRPDELSDPAAARAVRHHALGRSPLCRQARAIAHAEYRSHFVGFRIVWEP
jgi:formylglycine-generating enzyme required for sulfatase activity